MRSMVVAVALLVGCQNGPGKEAISHKDDYQQAYIYGFPIVAAYKAMYEFSIDKANSQYKTPFNTIWNDSKTFTPKDTAIVTPNADTPYSLLEMDLRAEPLVICVPKIEKSRYYAVQLSDLYSYNVGYIGSRTTGNDVEACSYTLLSRCPGCVGVRTGKTASADCDDAQAHEIQGPARSHLLRGMAVQGLG